MLMLLATTVTYALAQTTTGTDPHGQMGKMNMKHPTTAETLSLEKIHSEHLPLLLLSIDKATKAVESGDKKAALAELYKAQKQAKLAKVKPELSQIHLGHKH